MTVRLMSDRKLRRLEVLRDWDRQRFRAPVNGRRSVWTRNVLKLNGEEALVYDPNPDDAQRQRVMRAAASCPVQAIIVDQLDKK